MVYMYYTVYVDHSITDPEACQGVKLILYHLQ